MTVCEIRLTAHVLVTYKSFWLLLLSQYFGVWIVSEVAFGYGTASNNTYTQQYVMQHFVTNVNTNVNDNY